jgi:hypothetical protein
MGGRGLLHWGVRLSVPSRSCAYTHTHFTSHIQHTHIHTHTLYLTLTVTQPHKLTHYTRTHAGYHLLHRGAGLPVPSHYYIHTHTHLTSHIQHLTHYTRTHAGYLWKGATCCTGVLACQYLNKRCRAHTYLHFYPSTHKCAHITHTHTTHLLSTGYLWEGANCCTGVLACQYLNKWEWRCRAPAGTNPPNYQPEEREPTPRATAAATTPPYLCARAYQQCGGMRYIYTTVQLCIY